MKDTISKIGKPVGTYIFLNGIVENSGLKTRYEIALPLLLHLKLGFISFCDMEKPPSCHLKEGTQDIFIPDNPYNVCNTM